MLNLPVIEESVFLLIDMQERLVKAMSDIESCLNRQQMLLAGAGLLGWRVIVTEQYPRGLGPTVPAIAAALPAGTPVVATTAFSCFGEPLFVDAVDFVSPRALIVAGIEAHVCVQQTVLDALNSGFSSGYEVFVAADAVASRKPGDVALALELMRQAGAVITSSEALLFMLLRGAEHPQFKAISQLVR